MPVMVDTASPIVALSRIVGNTTSDSYTENMAHFDADYRVVSAMRRENGNQIFTLPAHGAQGNLPTIADQVWVSLTQPEGIKVGYEIEFDSGNTDSIATDLYAGNYTESEYMEEYHADEGATASWRFESDCSVSGGEVISPPMSPATFTFAASLNDVLGILRDNGALSDTRNPGTHINIDGGHMSNADWKRFALIWTRYEDSIYRLMANPYRTGAHRRNSYDVAPDMARILRGGRLPWGRCGVNFDHLVNAPSSGYVEFRLPDASLSLEVMQYQTAILLGMMKAARNPAIEEHLAQMEERPRGYQRQKMKDADVAPSSRLTGNDWVEATENIRSFVDLIFPGDQSMKSGIVTLFAMNKVWAFKHRSHPNW